ncbi:hypothetical protein B0O99DRAFT_151369 [Bisporella sp. PMI_857]|nr:hypothetical protein B0O99DRAFT_151369 [Bisporella sp. PMI_857]
MPWRLYLIALIIVWEAKKAIPCNLPRGLMWEAYCLQSCKVWSARSLLATESLNFYPVQNRDPNPSRHSRCGAHQVLKAKLQIERIIGTTSGKTTPGRTYLHKIYRIHIKSIRSWL